VLKTLGSISIKKNWQ